MSGRPAALLAGGVLVALGCGGTSSPPPPVFTCVATDPCVVPLARVVEICGGTAATVSRQSLGVGFDVIGECFYRAPGDTVVFATGRACHMLASVAMGTYVGARKDATPGFMSENLDGLGDRAFFQTNVAERRAQLIVLRENMVFDVSNFELSDPIAAKAGMTVLAGDLLAAQ